MINEVKLRELFDAKLKSVDPQKHFLAALYQGNFFEWFKFGFECSYGAPLFAQVRQNMSEERQAQILKSLGETSKRGVIVAEPDSKFIFVYSWRSAQQRTMIILADSREEADSIFKSQFEECAESPDHFVPTYYVTQLFVDGGESTIIYNN